MKLKYIIFFIVTASGFFPCYAPIEQNTERKIVKVLSLNIGLMSALFGTVSIGLKKNSMRAFMLAKAIKNMNKDEQPDIIAFQEAFDKRRLRSLYNSIKDQYPYSFFDDRVGAFLGGVNSGLVIFSKYPIVRRMIKDYDCWAGVEALARKGTMCAEISVQGCPFYLFNTHLQAGVDREWYIRMFGVRPRSCEGEDPGSLTSSQIVQKELRQAAQEIKKFIGTQDYFNFKAPLVFVGDFNISRLRDSNDYDAFLKTFSGALDTFYNGAQEVKSTSWEHGTVASTETDRVDYIWILNPSDDIDAHSNIVKTFPEAMTDHLGIIGNISFSCEN